MKKLMQQGFMLTILLIKGTELLTSYENIQPSFLTTKILNTCLVEDNLYIPSNSDFSDTESSCGYRSRKSSAMQTPTSANIMSLNVCKEVYDDGEINLPSECGTKAPSDCGTKAPSDSIECGTKAPSDSIECGTKKPSDCASSNSLSEFFYPNGDAILYPSSPIVYDDLVRN